MVDFPSLDVAGSIPSPALSFKGLALPPFLPFPFVSKSPRASLMYVVRRQRHIGARQVTTKEYTWSMRETAGHLLDLEALWMARVRDLQAGNLN